MGSIPGFSSPSVETLRGHMTIFQDKLLTRTDCDETGECVVPNVLSPRDLYSKRINKDSGISQLFCSRLLYQFKTYKTAFKVKKKNTD